MYLLKLHLLLLLLPILAPLCFSSYPLPEEFNSGNGMTTFSGGCDKPSIRNWMSWTDSEALAPSPSVTTRTIINVDSFLRKGRRGDHTKAFKRAWKKACSIKGGVFLVPRHKYRVRPIKFLGPCRSHFAVKILGKIEASENLTHYRDGQHWLMFENIRNFRVDGGGTIDGNGHIWWHNSCKINKTMPCHHAPTAVTFVGCKNMVVNGLRIMNAQQMHLTFQRCNNVRASHLLVKSPATSPNTDGIHLTQSRNIFISRSLLQTGDDCISIVDGSKKIKASDIKCGPGHGISIGSLGKGQSKDHVSDVSVNRAIFSGTSNGVRIKTWQGGQGYAKNIVFQNIVMHNVSNPIIIDQHYCDQRTPCHAMKSAVRVQNVVYKNIRGTSATKVAIKLDCSKNYWCKGIVLQNVKLVKTGDVEAHADCHNVKLVRRGSVSPTCFPDP
ncbi:hypothetical protein RND81_10G111900 [Saponaria officinalis]|uniref:endo-polygalacturonase n=1 Tax=Saponaria officinalis TaxID=3572 RepID=A0AAW1I1B3_SAPOF